MGTQYRVGDASESGVCGASVFRQDGAKAPTESDPCVAAEGWVLAALRSQSGATSRRVDRDCCAGADQRSYVLFGPGATGKKQAICRAAHDRTEPAAGNAGVRSLRLCLVPLFGPDQQAEALLLPLPGVRRLAPSETWGVRECARPPGRAGRVCLARGHAIVGESEVGASGDQSSAASGQTGRSGAATAAASVPRTVADRQKRGAPLDRLPRKPAFIG